MQQEMATEKKQVLLNNNWKQNWKNFHQPSETAGQHLLISSLMTIPDEK